MGRSLIINNPHLLTVDRSTRFLFYYDPSRFFAETDAHLPEDASVLTFVRFVENKAQYSVMRRFSDFIRDGTVTNETQSTELNEFEIVGYYRSIPFVIEINFDIDWEYRHVKVPGDALVHPRPHQPIDRTIKIFGQYLALKNILEVNSDIYRELMGAAPMEFSLVLSNKPLFTEQAVTLIHAMLRIEAEHNGRAVGPPFTIVTIPQGGNANIVSYPD